MIQEYLLIIGQWCLKNWYTLLAILGGIILIKVILKYLVWIIATIVIVAIIYYLLVYTDVGTATITGYFK